LGHRRYHPLLQVAQVVPTDDYRDLTGADVEVVTVGANVTVGQSRLDVLGENAGVIPSVMGELDRTPSDAAVVITGNPVYVLTRIAIEYSAWPEHLIMGTGTLVDTTRLRYQLARALRVEPVDAYAAVGVDRLILRPQARDGRGGARALRRRVVPRPRAHGVTSVGSSRRAHP
jgi:malate/lactate dehydrogenase